MIKDSKNIKKPQLSEPPKKVGKNFDFVKKVGHTMDIARSKSLAHIKKPMKTIVSQPNQLKDNQNIKTKLIPDKKNKSPVTINNETPKEPPINNKPRRKPIKLIIILALLVIILAGSLTYLFLPNLSIKIASLQAGIKASYPEYQPDDYRLKGPVRHEDKAVIIEFKIKSGTDSFIIKQIKSDFDSSAVKAKIEKDFGNKIITTSEKGLTIFTYDNKAMWVNGGILYTISGDALLSTDQIRRIATSM